MKLFGVIDEDFVNYKKISMILEFPTCTFKCNKEQGCKVCQNSHLSSFNSQEYNTLELIKHYLSNDITEAIVMQGLEPFDSFEDLFEFISKFRDVCDDDIVIYSGYTVEEIKDKLTLLKMFDNIIVKFGRFIPSEKAKFDEVLGVNLVSPNQYASYLHDLDL